MSASLALHRARLLRLLFAAALAFNLVWLVVAPLAGMFHEHVFLRANTLREIAYQHYYDMRPGRFVGTALYDLYEPETVLISPDILSLIQGPEGGLELRRAYFQVQLVEDTAGHLSGRPAGEIEWYRIGPQGQEVGFLVPEPGDRVWPTVVAVHEGDRVLFVPVGEEE